MNNLIYKLKEIPKASETFVISHIAQAINHGFNVSIIPTYVHPISESSQEDLIRSVSLLQKIKKYNSQPVKSKRIKSAFLFLCNPLMFYYYIKFCRLERKITLEHIFCLKFYKKYNAQDTFHVHFAKAIEPLLTLKKIGFLKSKIIVTFHGYDAYDLPKKENLAKLTKTYAMYVDVITVNSEFLKNQLVSKGFDSGMMHVIPVGVDTSYFKCVRNSVQPKTPFQLISVGRLIPLKGHIYGIQVVKQLVDKGYDIHYTIVGYGALMEMLKQTITDLGLQDHVTLTGLKTQEEIKALLIESDVFLMTSTHNEENRREALGIVSLEAQAVGVPVIGFDSGGFPETVIHEHTGFVVPDRDIFAMTQAIEKLLVNNALLASMRQKAVTHVKTHFDIGQIAKDYFNLYT